jgi:hypothetical protein
MKCTLYPVTAKIFSHDWNIKVVIFIHSYNAWPETSKHMPCAIGKAIPVTGRGGP